MRVFSSSTSASCARHSASTALSNSLRAADRRNPVLPTSYTSSRALYHSLSCSLFLIHTQAHTFARSQSKAGGEKKNDTEEQLGFLWFLSSQEGRSRSPDVVQMTQDSRHRISAPLLMTKQKSFGRF